MSEQWVQSTNVVGSNIVLDSIVLPTGLLIASVDKVLCFFMVQLVPSGPLGQDWGFRSVSNYFFNFLEAMLC